MMFNSNPTRFTLSLSLSFHINQYKKKRWRQRGGPPPISDKRPPHGAHFSPFSFETLGPSVPIPQPFGRKSGGGSGASRQSQDGSVTDLHIEYTQQVTRAHTPIDIMLHSYNPPPSLYLLYTLIYRSLFHILNE